MTTPSWYSQPFPATGSISAEGIKKTLGKPPIPWPTILVREAAQNSWDARLNDHLVRFTLSLDVVQPQHLNAWQNALLNGAPPADRFSLRRSLRNATGGSPVIRTLTVSDRGTKGLGGPTRADAPRGSGPRDWVSFVLNVGDPPDTKNGGGTYGYGKGVLFQVSRAGTVIVHTRTMSDHGLENRLIGVCLGESYELAESSGHGRPYTGRHWWGVVGDEHVEPLTYDDAITAANSLGLPRFMEDETGTDLIVVDPDFDMDSDAETATYLADSIAWNLWPIMLERRGSTRLTADVRCMGRPVAVPVPEETRGLKMFVAAYERMADVTETRAVKCNSPKRDLGKLALERQLVRDYDPPAAAQDLGVTGSLHHICLLRTPELVVKYHAGPPPVSTDIAYAGVFRCQDDLDRVYAASEPPTHDDWVPTQLQGHERTFVRVTFTRLKEELAEYVKPAETAISGVRAPLGGISNYLGSLIAAASGTGSAVTYSFQGTATSGSADGYARSDGFDPAGTSSGVDGTGVGAERVGTAKSAKGVDINDDSRTIETTSAPIGGSRSAGARLHGEPYFVEETGLLRLAQDVVVTSSGRLSIEGIATVAIADGTIESRPPVQADHPVVLGWRTEEGLIEGHELTIEHAREGSTLTLLISPAPDTVTQVGFTARRRAGTADGN